MIIFYSNYITIIYIDEQASKVNIGNYRNILHIHFTCLFHLNNVYILLLRYRSSYKLANNQGKNKKSYLYLPLLDSLVHNLSIRNLELDLSNHHKIKEE